MADSLQATGAETVTNEAERPREAREERLQQLVQAQRLAAGLTVAAVVLALVALFGPQPNDRLLALLVALPLLALLFVIAWRDRFRIGLGAGSAQANLAAPCAVAACALFARTWLDLNLVSWLPLIAFALAVGLIFLVAAARFESNLRRRWWRLIAAAVITAAYAFGVLGQFDQRLDGSPQSMLRSRIVEKHLGHSRIATYHLALAPWGPFDTVTDATVLQDLYERLETGDPVCVRLRDGAFGIAWFTVAACR
ncbi:hypothetical protein ACQR1W_34815 [Bradyrhizobium sp. HKCCYLS1011]|uniref:hypothetical protein n=1 Tax=Bradyrhizobium sp. HKCCYLS1011 TaxID=3420733 RepID=UPI003EBB13B9